jgi:hypothetical protein
MPLIDGHSWPPGDTVLFLEALGDLVFELKSFSRLQANTLLESGLDQHG